MRHKLLTRFGQAPVLVVMLLAMSLLLGACGGMTATSVEATLIGPQDYKAQFDPGTDHALIDVRTPQEYAGGHIPGSVNIPVESLASRLDEVPHDKPVVVYCRSGNRSATAADILVENGYKSVFDLGGIQDWIAQGFAVE